jgi:glycosyltransferase involved in cell wall biosynthesis
MVTSDRMNDPRAGVIAVVLKGYPRLSETFIAQELHALEARGLPLALYSLRHPTDREAHPIHGEIRAPVVYLPEYLYQEPLRVLRGWRNARRLPGYRRALAAFRRDFRRDLTSNRIRRFGQALVLAAELPRNVVALHAHFMHTPASVTRYAALLRGLPWSCSAHAKDIWTTPDWEKREKLEDCAWITTCTETNARHLRGLSLPGRVVDLNYHGIDTRRFPAPPSRNDDADGSDAGRPVRILAVGRAVDKKDSTICSRHSLESRRRCNGDSRISAADRCCRSSSCSRRGFASTTGSNGVVHRRRKSCSTRTAPPICLRFLAG